MDATHRSSFGELLQHRRRMLGLTQEELAERAELSVRQLAYLERGRHIPRPGTIRRLGEALGLSEEDYATLLTSVQDSAPSLPPRARRPSLAVPRIRPGLRRGPALAAGVAVLLIAGVALLYSAMTGRARAELPVGPQPVAVWGSPLPQVQHFSQPDGIAVDRLGKVYVADFDRNIVQELSNNGQPIAEFGGGRGGAAHVDGPTALTVDAAGNLYVIDHSNGRLQKISPEGAALASWHIHGNGVALDGQGQIYTVDGSRNVVERFSSDGALLTTWGVPRNPAGPANVSEPLNVNRPLGIAVDAHGHVYIADTGNHRFEVLSAGGRLLLTHHMTEVPPPAVSLPESLAVDSKGDIYVADTGDALVVKYAPDGRFLARWSGASTGPGAFGLPVALTVDSRGTVYVADAETARVDKLSPDGRLLASWTRTGNNEVYFDDPQDLALNRHGDIYIVQGRTARVVKLSPNGKLVASWSTLHAPHSGPNLHHVPSAITVDARGRIYVAEGSPFPGNYQVDLWSPGGQLLHSMGRFHNATGLTVDAHGNLWIAEHVMAILEYSPTLRLRRRWTTIAPLLTNWVVGIAVDAQGNVYVPDGNDKQVIKLGPQGKILARFAERGPSTFGDNGPSSEAVDAQGRIYIAEPDRDQVQILSPNGKLLQTLGRKGSAPGEFTTPIRVAIDSRGNLYVLDAQANPPGLGDARLQKFAPAG